MKISKKELSRLAKEFPLVRDYIDDKERVAKNIEVAIWFLKNKDLILQVIYNYDRVVNLVKDEVDD
jgi:PII-like signaling protein